VTEGCAEDSLLGKGNEVVRVGEGCWVGIICFKIVLWVMFLELYRIYS
jgi:hypothetical protein